MENEWLVSYTIKTRLGNICTSNIPFIYHIPCGSSALLFTHRCGKCDTKAPNFIILQWKLVYDGEFNV